MRTSLFKPRSILIAITIASSAQAGYEPIRLTSDSYNHDVIVEKTAPTPVVPVTTASMDNGTANIGFSWFERGYNSDWPATGIPEAGSVLTSDAAADHRYQFAPSYKTNNVILIDSSSQRATLSLAKPAPYSALSFLTSSGGGSKTAIRYTLHYQDDTEESGSIVSQD